MNADNGNDKAFLNRLTSIVEANLNNEKFGVSELAEKMRLNRSYVHRKLKSITKKSISEFIREIRLQKAKELLEQGNDNISEVAYNVGFSSPSYFSKCFHDFYGYSPIDAKKNNQKEIRIDNVNDASETKGTTKTELKIKFSGKKKVKIVLGYIVLIIVSFLIYRYFDKKTENFNRDNTPISIAILPLKNLSNNPEIQYLADGIMEDILSRLSYVDGLAVKSRISSAKIGNENLTAREVAKEMDVEYFLEGSILPENDKIRINVQLISANEDKHVWADHFDKYLTEILPFITEVSAQITNQLEIILSPEEKEQVEKNYTENKEAYDLYLQGRFYHRLRTKESFQKSLEFHAKALELDSNYCLAYAGLADVYVTGTWFGNFTRDEGISKSRAYALKALSIDKNLAEAHATLGAIATYFDYDWETAEKELKLAMTLNPQYSRAYHLFAQYLTVIGKEEEAHYYINKAIELEPSDRQLNWCNYYLYSREGNYEDALVLSDKVNYIDGNEWGHFWRNLKIYLRQNQITKVIEEFKNFQSLISSGVASEKIDSIYAEKGKDGFIRFIIEYDLQKKELFPYDIAAFYSIINEKDSAINYLERSFESGDGGLVRALGEKEFDNLRSEPRFKALIKKTNLEDIDFIQ